MLTWAEMHAQNAQNDQNQTAADNDGRIPANTIAGFINKAEPAQGLTLVVDVQAPASEPGSNTGSAEQASKGVLRTWAILSAIGSDQKEHFNNLQLTFNTDGPNATALAAKGGGITRDDIRLLLQAPTTQLDNITVTRESDGTDSGSGDTHQPRSERYDVTVDELRQHPEDAAAITQTMQAVLQVLAG
jgi:hypothetical protein